MPGFRNEKGSEPGSESIREGIVRDTTPSNPCEPKPYQQLSGRNDEFQCSIVRPVVEGDHNRDTCPDGSALRDPHCGESLDGEPVPNSTGFEDGETPVEQEKATPVSSNNEQGWRISSQVAVVYATFTTSNRPVQQQCVPRNRTGENTTEENKFFDPGGSS